MSGHHQFTAAVAPDCIGSQGIVSRHMSVDNPDLALANEAREFASTKRIEGVKQAKGGNVGS